MKKRVELFKTIQLILLFIITCISLVIVFTNEELYQMVGRNPSIRVLCIILWLTLLSSFAFIFWDFSTHSSYKKDYRELDYAVYNDRVAGIANRYSCDAMISKYLDKPLPETVGCVMLDISNIQEINAAHGHVGGNEAISDFSNILHTASVGLCFVGRNGGNKFMALFEDCAEDKLNEFLTRVNRQIEQNNSLESHARIEYRTGRAFARDEKATSITALISLADRRLDSKNDAVTGFSNRAGCDDIIALYLEKALPDNMVCAMMEISNIRQINEKLGHLEGNRYIRSFGDVLRDAAKGICFVGRNGGSKFLAVFEDGLNEHYSGFAAAVARGVEQFNASSEVPLEYRIGCAWYQDNKNATINSLVALADQKMRSEQ